MTATHTSGKPRSEAIEIMVKGFEDCPSRLWLIEDNGEVVVAQSLMSDATIGLHREWVFRWSEGLFSRLEEAYERSDSEALSKLWERAEPLS